MQAAQRGAWPAEKRAVADRQKAAAALATRSRQPLPDGGRRYLQSVSHQVSAGGGIATMSSLNVPAPISGGVNASFTTSVTYAGPALSLATTYYWYVLANDTTGSEFSASAIGAFRR